MMGLTPMQIDCARVIAELTAVIGRAPTMREIQHEMDLKSSFQVQRLVRQLRERGWCAHGRKAVLLCDPPPAPPECAIEMTNFGREELLRTSSSGRSQAAASPP